MKLISGTIARAAVVSCGIAAVTAAVVTAAPALGAARRANAAASAATPVIISGFKNLATISGSATVATLPIPAGRWAIFAKADVSTQGGGPVELHCVLKAGTTADHTDPELESGGTSAFNENIALNMAHTFTGAGSAALSCDSSGVAVDVTWIKITAIKAGTLRVVKMK
jgi:hypothetical protein